MHMIVDYWGQAQKGHAPQTCLEGLARLLCMATLNNLAMLYYLMGDDARAEPLYLQCKEIEKKALGEVSSQGSAASANLERRHFGSAAGSLNVEAKKDNSRTSPELWAAFQISGDWR